MRTIDPWLEKVLRIFCITKVVCMLKVSQALLIISLIPYVIWTTKTFVYANEQVYLEILIVFSGI
jgi:hypothetical protein